MQLLEHMSSSLMLDLIHLCATLFICLYSLIFCGSLPSIALVLSDKKVKQAVKVQNRYVVY